MKLMLMMARTRTREREVLITSWSVDQRSSPRQGSPAPGRGSQDLSGPFRWICSGAQERGEVVWAAFPFWRAARLVRIPIWTRLKPSGLASKRRVAAREPVPPRIAPLRKSRQPFSFSSGNQRDDDGRWRNPRGASPSPPFSQSPPSGGAP